MYAIIAGIIVIILIAFLASALRDTREQIKALKAELLESIERNTEQARRAGAGTNQPCRYRRSSRKPRASLREGSQAGRVCRAHPKEHRG